VPNPTISIKGIQYTNPIQEDIENRYRNAIRNLDGSPDVLSVDKTMIHNFIDNRFAHNISKSRVTKYIYHLIVLCRLAKRPLGELDKKAIEQIIGKINISDYQENTKHDYKVITKKYFQWLRGCNEDEKEYPEEVRWIKAHIKKNNLPAEEQITPLEIKELAEVAENQRDRTLILTHYDSGCRIGETLNLTVGDVSFDKYGGVLRVHGKTGPRTVRIIPSVPALALYLSLHPYRKDPKAPLWLDLSEKNKGKAMSYEAARKVFRTLAKKAVLNKRVHTHLFRHARATELANVFTEAQMKVHFGWVRDSDMAAVYVHLSGRDVDGALLKSHGLLKDQEQAAKPVLSVLDCPRCGKQVISTAQFCPFCGMAVNLKAALSLEDSREKADNILDILMKDTEVKALLSRKLKDLFGSSEPPPPF